VSKQSVKRTEALAEENAKLRGQVAQLRRSGAFSSVAKVFGDFFRAAMVTLPFFFIWLCVHDLAGKRTDANIDARVQGDVRVESDSLTELLKDILTEKTLGFLLAALGAGGVLYGRAQHKLRRDDIQMMQPYKEKYEKLIDDKRSSSRLTKRGDTRSEDL
jgi:hypothetical protein